MPTTLQAVGWAMRPLPLLQRCAERYGEVFTLRVRHRSPWVVLTNPAAIKLVFTADAQTQKASAVEASPTLGPLLGPRSVMLLDEPEHMTHRKLMLPAFHGERMSSYAEMVEEVACRELASWPSGEQLALWPRMQAISSEVLMRAVFGAQSSEHLVRLRESLRALTSWLNDPRRLAVVTTVGSRWLSHNAGFHAVMKPVEAAVLAEVQRRRARATTPEGDEHEGEDILTMLERAHERNGTPMGAQQLRDELVTLLSDGPTSTSLAWAFERLLRHPDKLERLREEVTGGAQEDYVDAVVKETLRLCPVVPLIMRKLLTPLELDGYTIPANTTVAPSAYLVHHREDIYPKARAFMPERFLASEGGQAISTYAWIPFGGGVRRCVAASFAQLTVKRVIQTVLREVDLHPVSRATASEGATRSSVAFAPGEKALAIVARRAPAYGRL